MSNYLYSFKSIQTSAHGLTTEGNDPLYYHHGVAFCGYTNKRLGNSKDDAYQKTPQTGQWQQSHYNVI